MLGCGLQMMMRVAAVATAPVCSWMHEAQAGWARHGRQADQAHKGVQRRIGA